MQLCPCRSLVCMNRSKDHQKTFQCLFHFSLNNLRRYYCKCNSGFRMKNDKCEEIDPCEQPHRGSCHLQVNVTGWPGKLVFVILHFVWWWPVFLKMFGVSGIVQEDWTRSECVWVSSWIHRGRNGLFPWESVRGSQYLSPRCHLSWNAAWRGINTTYVVALAIPGSRVCRKPSHLSKNLH